MPYPLWWTCSITCVGLGLVHVKELLQHVHDELHRRVIVVVEHDDVAPWLRHPRALLHDQLIVALLICPFLGRHGRRGTSTLGGIVDHNARFGETRSPARPAQVPDKTGVVIRLQRVSSPLQSVARAITKARSSSAAEARPVCACSVPERSPRPRDGFDGRRDRRLRFERPAALHEREHCGELSRVEPSAVRVTDVDYYAARPPEVSTVHASTSARRAGGT